MTAKEVREFRSTCKKLVEAEERSKLLKELVKYNVSFGEEENFLRNSQSKFRVLGNKGEGDLRKNHDEIVKASLKIKIKDNKLYGVKMRKRRDWLRRKLEETWGTKSQEYRDLMDQIKKTGRDYRKKLKHKNSSKVKHLVRKFGKKRHEEVLESMTDEMREMMGDPDIFDDEKDVRGEEMKNPVLVEGKDGPIAISEDERELLRLGPKFCLLKNLSEEEFETDVEGCVMKIKWDLMGDNEEPRKEDIALRILLGERECRQIDEEREEEEEMLDAECRSIFDPRTKTINFGKRRATDLKGNSRVFFPSKPRSVKEESALQTLRDLLMNTFSEYLGEKCDEKGGQKMNLTKGQSRGLKLLKKRVKEGELVVLPTDKSGNLAVMTRGTYEEAGFSHTVKDKEVTWEEVRDAQRELNGHVSMLIKFFKIGSHWNHGFRARETMMKENQAVCPLSLLYKDHKGWTPSKMTPPPTRPVAGGHLGINMNISEIVSDLLDPVVMEYKGGKEVISTEDTVARMEILNDCNSGWTSTSYWGGMIEDEYVACLVCGGESNYTWDEDTPELCCCEDQDGVDEEGRIIITQGAMKQLRRRRWEELVRWDPQDLERRFQAKEMLPEDRQDQTIPMVVIGTDVVNLYPSLNIKKLVKEVGTAVLESGVQWEELDYLEGARYVALNWSEARCRSSPLGRILPWRRKTGGRRPGLTGCGPQGPGRGDTEQWVFPTRVRLRREEKRLLVATVIELATEAMFENHFYGFGNKMFKQMEGGPIGLRGTCTIARLCMQIFDKRWTRLVEEGVSSCHCT